MALGGVRYRAVGRGGLLQRSRQPAGTSSPREEEGEDLVEGETARGEHQLQPRSTLAYWPTPPTYLGLESPQRFGKGGGLKLIKLVAGDLRPFWGAAAGKSWVKLPLFNNGLSRGAWVLSGDNLNR